MLIKLDHFPKFSGWKFQKIFELPPPRNMCFPSLWPSKRISLWLSQLSPPPCVLHENYIHKKAAKVPPTLDFGPRLSQSKHLGWMCSSVRSIFNENAWEFFVVDRMNPQKSHSKTNNTNTFSREVVWSDIFYSPGWFVSPPCFLVMYAKSDAWLTASGVETWR